MGFGFERPLLAIAALIIIPLGIIIARRLGNPFTASIPLGPPGGVPYKAPVNLTGIVRTLRIMEYCGVLLLFSAAAGPVMITTETVWLNRGADILFVLDISPSMAALDMDGSSRFSVATGLIKNFTKNRPSDSIGLAAVGKEAALLIPPTTDRELFNSRLDSLRLGELGDGTALGMGLALAVYHLDRSTAQRKVVILISDGENNAGAIHPHTAAAILRDSGISLWVIGIGSGGEVPIDYIDPFTRIRRTGMYDSRYDTEALIGISTAGGGNWILSHSTDALVSAFTLIDDREMIVRQAGIVRRTNLGHFPFLLTAFCLILTAFFIRRIILGAWF